MGQTQCNGLLRRKDRPPPGVDLIMTTLSVLDLATVAKDATPADALADTTRLARVVEALGYHRMWVAEHHGMPAVASSAPAVLIGHLADATTTLRVGAGGVMLPNHAPLVVAEQFATLEALHPGRIDLGLGRAPGTDPATARALRRSADLGAEHFPEDVVELINYLIDDDGPATTPAPVPGRGYLPQVWLLGSSTFSAQLAGMLGLPFSFAFHFAPALVDEAVALYRGSFQRTGLLADPYVMVAASVLCADTDEEADYLAGPSRLSMLQLRKGTPSPVVSPEEAAAYPFTPDERAVVEAVTVDHAVGDPDTVHRKLTALVERTGADELMLSTRAHSLETRARSLTLVAERWGLDAAD
jgi:luciferase family oxidoreductase group 1